MGEVWRAADSLTDDRIVAVKVLPESLSHDELFKQRFRREAQVAAKLNSPHVIPIHSYGAIEGRLYVDMRLIEGHDLQAVLADGPLDPARAVRIIEQAAQALHAAHKVGLVHRDVKPSNILLDEDDFAYLIDFGIARAADQPALTGTGSMVGTVHYMAPERFRAGDVDARADIYALACVLYECLTGRRPYPGERFEQQLAAHLSEPPPRPSNTQPDVPADFDAVIATGMANNPDERYASTVDLARAASEAITTPIPRPETAPPTPRAPPPVLPDQRSIPRPGPVPEPASPTEPASRPAAAAPAQPYRAPRPAVHVSPTATTRHDPPSGPPPAPLIHPPPPGVVPPPARTRWWRRKIVIIPAAVMLAVIAAIATTVVFTTSHRVRDHEVRYGAQVTLPVTGLECPCGGGSRFRRHPLRHRQ